MTTSKYTARQLGVKLATLLTVKKVLFGLNFFVWAAGCTAACIGIWFRIERDYITLIQRLDEAEINLSAGNIYLGANLLISIGSIIAFVGILGSFSIIKENKILIIIYSFLLLCVFFLYVTVAAEGFDKIIGFNKINLKGIVSDAMRELFTKSMIQKIQTAKYAVNEIQKQLQCCGNVGPSEYAGDIPPSCSSYVVGCNQVVYDFFWRNTLLMAVVALVFCFSHIVVILVAVYFANEIRIAEKVIKDTRKFIKEKEALLSKPAAEES